MRRDLAIIGAGPGGYVAALRARQLGMSVTLIERSALGGVCLNRGCIPTKALLQAGALAHDIGRADVFGLRTGGVAVDFPAVIRRRDRVVSRLREGVRTLLERAGVTIAFGDARLLGPMTVAVEGIAAGDDSAGRAAALTEVEASHVLIATGSRPVWPAIPGAEHPRVIDSDGVMALREPPAGLVVVGGGPAGTQIAAAFARLGSTVTIVEASPSLLPLKEPETSAVLAAAMRREGITIHTGTTVAAVSEADDALLQVALSPLGIADPDGPALPERRRRVPATLRADLVVVAVGRVPLTVDLGLEATGVLTGADGSIIVDEAYVSSVSSILAVGDAVGGAVMLADRAARQGIVAVEALAGLAPRPVRDDRVPQVVFTDPEVASVGLTEAKARRAGHAVITGMFPLAASGRAVLSGTERGLVKVVAEEGSGRLLGVHMAGTHLGELLAEGVLALELGATLDDLASVVRTHPTLSEALGEAALTAYGGALHLPAGRGADRRPGA